MPRTSLSLTQKAIASACSFALAASVCAFPCTTQLAFADAKSDLDEANQVASEASSVYDEAKEKVDQLNADIEEKTASLEDLEQNQLPKAKSDYVAAVRQIYMGGNDPVQVIIEVMTGESLHEVFNILNAYDRISSWRENALVQVRETRDEIAAAKTQLEAEKTEADAALADAEAKKQEALEAQSAARAAYQATLPQNIPTTRRAPTSSSFYDEASARAFIVMKESGGNYNARNGRYIGAYQLTNTYLNGDYSPENQDRVAEQYVSGRYGSWMAAANFWVSHGWY